MILFAENAHLPMKNYLKAWRLHRGLSQEEVGLTLKKRHTTIGRWERGAMIKREDLQALSKIYGASESQLLAPPEEADLVEKLDRLQSVVRHMPPDQLSHYIAIGEALLGNKK